MNHDQLVLLLPAGDPVRRLEAYLSLTAVLAYLRSLPARGNKYRVMSTDDAPRVAVLYRLPLLTIRWAIGRLIRATP